MEGRSRVGGRCPTCGPLTLLPGDFVCALPSVPDAPPLELTEEKSGPPLSADELFELHSGTPGMCGPQAELVGGGQ